MEALGNYDFPAITYDELFSNKLVAIEKEKNMVISIHEKNRTNHPTHVAGDNGDRWFKEGLGSEFLELEKSLNKYFEKEPISCLCGYNPQFIPNNENIQSILSSHKYVILDNPLMIYKRSEN